jgi:mutator protein MutT
MTNYVTEQVRRWAEKLRDVSAYGLTFCKNPYDLENYEKIQDIAVEMTAILTDQLIEDFEPIRKTIVGRPTPLIAVDAAIVNDQNEILLIRRTDNGEWALPGGYLDVGETAAEGVVREVMEEVGIQVKPFQLVGIFDSRRKRSAPLNQLCIIVFLCNPIDETKMELAFKNQTEVLDKRWCSKASLQDLDMDPYLRLWVERAFQSLCTGFHSYFD